MPKNLEIEQVEIKKEMPQPSEDFAWILGFLCGGQSGNRKRIASRDSSFEAMEKFRLMGETVFGLPAFSKTYEKSLEDPKKSDIHEVKFYSTDLVKFIGDLRKKHWVSTIISSHIWVYSEPRYQWLFLSGFFDKSGYVSNPLNEKHRYRVELNNSIFVGCQELKKMMNDVGLRGIQIKPDKRKSEGVAGVGLYRWGEIRNFALSVSSSVGEKEERLDIYRQHEKYTVEEFQLRMEAYQKVLALRKTGLSAKDIFYHSDIVPYGFSFTRIDKWVYAGTNPRRHPAFQYLSVEMDSS